MKCELCGKAVEYTMSFQTPGRSPSRAICRKCLLVELPKRVKATLEKRRRESKAAMPAAKRRRELDR